MSNCNKCGGNTLPSVVQEGNCGNLKEGTYEICYFDCKKNKMRFGTSVVSSGGTVKFYDELGELITDQVQDVKCPDCDDLCISKYLAINNVITSVDGSVVIKKELNDNETISYDLKVEPTGLTSSDGSVSISQNPGGYDLKVVHPNHKRVDHFDKRTVAGKEVVFAVYTDGSQEEVYAHPTDIRLNAGARNADGSITLSLTDGSVVDVPAQNIPIPVDTEVTDFQIINGDLVITESNGDTHTVTLPVNAEDVKLVDVTIDDDQMVFTMSDGSTITRLRPDNRLVRTSVENTFALFPNGDHTVQYYHMANGSVIQDDFSWLLPKYIPTHIFLQAKLKENHNDKIGVGTIMDADIPRSLMEQLGMRATDNTVILQVLCRAQARKDPAAPAAPKIDFAPTIKVEGGMNSAISRAVGAAIHLHVPGTDNDQTTSKLYHMPVKADGSVHITASLLDPINNNLEHLEQKRSIATFEVKIFGFERSVAG